MLRNGIHATGTQHLQPIPISRWDIITNALILMTATLKPKNLKQIFNANTHEKKTFKISLILLRHNIRLFQVKAFIL